MRANKSILITALAVLFACSSPTQNQGTSSEEVPAAETPAVAKRETNYPSTALGAIFQVRDISKWKEVYNREVPAEQQIRTFSSLENPRLIFVTQWSDGHANAMQLTSAPETREVMREGTMTGEPQFRYYDVKFFQEAPPEDSLRLVVSAEVLNYEMWKSDFDQDSYNREEAGLTLNAIGTDADNKNHVYVMFSTSDQQRVYDFLGANDIQQAIADAGVIGEPDPSWWRVTD